MVYVTGGQGDEVGPTWLSTSRPPLLRAWPQALKSLASSCTASHKVSKLDI